MIDILEHITAIQRHVSQTGEEVRVTLRRTYQAQLEEVWDAITDPDRIARWMLPITGELKVGGSFQLEGNAGGEILECDPPKRFKVTFGGPESMVEIRLTADAAGEAVELQMDHSVPAAFGGPSGALYVGPGWDGALLGLALYLEGKIEEGHDPREMANSPESLEFSAESIRAWTKAVRDSGLVPEDQLRPAVEAAVSQFAPGASVDDFL
ncbi:SRPBCC domain-containing protein [Kribbella sp. CA-293567]|uniref:SRPBCC domain-containing protein n=1 Tax=Kribbella sp. CA-293567 TaxID=3002436 RepID=UPI0022DE04B7|nr:SRPBCC domain-containing protein [Kribbella sp. CA-293567]WBQ03339.1 SRPBCC domain-containing protein [Kribbella sp. CA-293567]